MTKQITVVAQIISETGVTLYTETGQAIPLRSDGHRTANLVTHLTPLLAAHGKAVVDLDDFSATAVVEKRSNGLIRFFRVARKTVSSIFGGSTDRELDSSFNGGMQESPVSHERREERGVAPATPAQVEALAEASIPDLGADSHDTNDTTLVALVNDTPIVGAEALKTQIEAAAVSKNPEGFTRFMEMLAEVVATRKHSAQELLTFLEKADLPIADDGFIVGYKALKVVNEEKGTFADHHTGKVEQRVGSRVETPVERVDDNRRVLCSNGLHIARRKYLSNYGSKGIVTLVKIDPRDVISVPFNEPDKMRVAAYHIAAKIPAEAHAFIRSNKPMTQNPEAANILANVIAGKHAPITEIVHIGGALGGNVKVTKLGEDATVEMDKTIQAAVLDEKAEISGARIDPLEVNRLKDEALKAAMEGDMSAAVTTEEPAPVEEPNAETVAALEDSRAGNVERVETIEEALDPTKAKPKGKKKPAPKREAKRTAPAVNGNKPTEDRLKAQARALKLVKGGMSQREAARKTGVSARAIGRLLSK